MGLIRRTARRSGSVLLRLFFQTGGNAGPWHPGSPAPGMVSDRGLSCADTALFPLETGLSESSI